MEQKLKILHLEDIRSDSEIIFRELKKAGILYENLLVDNKEDFITALKEFKPHIILSDHSLPVFDSHEALRIVKEMGIRVPFILVTATVSEEYAVNIIKNGASDYILKDRLQRLPNAVLSALAQYNLEEDKQKAIETLRLSEQKYKLLFESNPMPMWIASESLDIIDVNEAAIKHYGYTRLEFLHLNAKDLRPAEDLNRFIQQVNKKNSGQFGIWRHKKKNGTIIMVDIIANDITYQGKPARLVLAHDVTEKLKAEAELANQQAMQKKLLMETSIAVQERERDEIGKELHDNINQILAATKLYLGLAIQKDPKMRPDLLQKSYENLGSAIELIRQLSKSLIAPSLGDITLVNAIQELVETIQIASPLKLDFNSNAYHEQSVDNEIQIMIYRIVQEQVNNILKHSKAEHVSINLSNTSTQITLLIEDDGVGFDQKKTFKGIGLRNMANRAEFFNGTLRISTDPGKGCRLELSVPLKRDGNMMQLTKKAV